MLDILKLIGMDKIFEIVRVIDPVKHKVITIREDLINIEQGNCYDVWKKGEACSDCISLRGFLSQITCTKIEHLNKKVFMIIAVPFRSRSKSYILELIKEIPGSTIDVDNIIDNEGLNRNATNIYILATMTDALTGIYNKRYIIKKLPEDILYHSLHNYPLSILMLDLDYFKRVNDNYGHIAGDFILCEIANILVKSVRESDDWVSRFGGEEFLICLPNTEKIDAMNIAERIRKTIENEIFHYEELTINITASLGVYTMRDSEVCDFNRLISYADHKLYEAKQSGRNKVVG